MDRFLRTYWISYFVGYLVAVALLLWLYWPTLLGAAAPVYLLSAIFGTAAGTASAFAIIAEVGGRAVLLIPKAANKLIDKGRTEGRKQGQEQRDERYQEAVKRFGVEVDGVIMLPNTPEIQEFLKSDPEESGK